MNEITHSNTVVYKNEMNSVSLVDFNSLEMDTLFAILSQMREKGTDEIIFTYAEIQKLSNFNTKRGKEVFEELLVNVFNKLLKCSILNETDDEIVSFVLFNKFVVNKNDEKIIIKINEDFAHLINKMSKNFTKFELQEFLNLKSKYSKTIYRLLKQVRLLGYLTISIEDFRRILDVPESYNMSKIHQKVLNPAIDELKNCFEKLEVQTLKGRGKMSRNVVAIRFDFKPTDDFEKGVKVFRDSQGNYYEQDILFVSKDEYMKAFPEHIPMNLGKNKK